MSTINNLTTKDGLLYMDGDLCSATLADHHANYNKFTCAEQLVRALEDFKFIQEAFHSYIDAKFKDKFKAINFKCADTLGSCVGFIIGVAQYNKLQALKLTQSFMFCLNQLNRHEMVESMNYNQLKIQAPNQYTYLGDDGTNMGFRFCIYSLIPVAEQASYLESGVNVSEFYGTKYLFRYNGGLLFHGLGEVMATTLDNSIGWKIHT